MNRLLLNTNSIVVIECACLNLLFVYFHCCLNVVTVILTMSCILIFGFKLVKFCEPSRTRLSLRGGNCHDQEVTSYICG